MNQYNNDNTQHHTHQYNLHLPKPITSPLHYYYRSASTRNIRPIVYGPQGNNFIYDIEGIDYNPYHRFGARKYDNGVIYINGKRYHNKPQKDNSLRNRNNQYGGCFRQEKQTQLSYNPLQIEQSNEMVIENNPYPSFRKISLREQKAIEFDIKPTVYKGKYISDRYYEPCYYLRDSGRGVISQRKSCCDNYYKDNYVWYGKSNYYNRMLNEYNS